MLSRLSIANYALIEQLDFYPGEGLSIITGETGAGKSIMLGALSLLKGERADMRVIADKNRKAVVEAEFAGIDGDVFSAINRIDPDWDGEILIIRREINPSGRSRAFINDSPATLQQLEEVAGGLLDIHSQNSNSLLSDPNIQLLLVDSVSSNDDLLTSYGEKFRSYVDLRHAILRQKEETAKNKAKEDMILFRLSQLDKLKPKAGELKKIESRYETLSNSEEIRENLIKARRTLDGGDGKGAIDQIDDARGALSDIDFSLWEEQDSEVEGRLRRCSIEIKDICETIENVLGMLESDPATLNALSARMTEYYSALKNFRMETDADLENLHKELKHQCETLENGDRNTEIQEREAREIAKWLKAQAALISTRRKEGASLLQKEIETEARKLGLENLRFEINIRDSKLSKTGGDIVEFLASFNKNAPLLPVGQIASGGESARLMLAIKKITASRLNLPTIIFDEIDTGVSGSIADRMGEMMMEMGKTMQILTITHLPQVAVKGIRHFKVYKEDREDRTVSDVKLLDEMEREEEIGRMLSGEEIDEAARINARSLLKKK